MEVVGWIVLAIIVVALLSAWRPTGKHSAAASFSKSKELRRLSRELATSPFDQGGDIVTNLLQGAKKKDQALSGLLDLCQSDPNVSQVMQKHGVQRADLEHLYQQLIAGGAGQWVAGHFVAASSLVFGQTLDYALGNLRTGKASLVEVAARLSDYFERGEVGPISD